ncbi:MAG TPA: hypothetical protein VKR58_13125, partial [Aquella sp.]|nr:hypothetical protein [Aquella sp.]
MLNMEISSLAPAECWELIICYLNTNETNSFLQVIKDIPINWNRVCKYRFGDFIKMNNTQEDYLRILDIYTLTKDVRLMNGKSDGYSLYVHPMCSNFYDSINFLCGITHLNLSYCGLRSLRKELFSLISLTYLDLSKNPLTEVPSDIGKLTKLE